MTGSKRTRLLVVLLMLGASAVGGAWFALGREVVLHREVSAFQTVVVVEEGGRRCLRFGDGPAALNQTCRTLSAPHRVELDYARAVVALALSVRPPPRRALVIGLGGGSIPTALADAWPALELDAVELDPAVVEVAANFFDFHTTKRVRVFAEDGLTFVARAAGNDEHYDLIILDAFDESSMPAPFTTPAFAAQLEHLTREGGVVIANSITPTPPPVFAAFESVGIGRNHLLFRGPVLVPSTTNEALSRIGADDAWLQRLVRR